MYLCRISPFQKEIEGKAWHHIFTDGSHVLQCRYHPRLSAVSGFTYSGYHVGTDSAPDLLSLQYADYEELLPEFLQQKDKMSGAARGTLYHWLFEHFDFTGDLRAQLSSFMQQELISTEERKRIRIADFEYFVQTPLGKKVKQAQEEGTYHREMPFILGVPAKEMIENDKKLSEKDENEYVSVQGVIDAWIDGEDYITLIDFKTDKKPEDMTDEEFKELLKKRYQVQLSYYKRALMQMTKRPVKEACIYAVSIGQTIFC